MSVARIDECCQVPLVTVIRLLGAARRRLNPESAKPGEDATPENDAAMIAELERRIRESKTNERRT